MGEKRTRADEQLAEALGAPGWGGHALEACPDGERIWDAACGRLQQGVDMARIIDHAARCAACFHELRAARLEAEDLGELLWPEAAPVEDRVGFVRRFYDFFGSGFSVVAATFMPFILGDSTGLALAWRPMVTGVVLALVSVTALTPNPPMVWSGTSSLRDTTAGVKVNLLVPDGQVLPRNDVVLRWQAIEDARYDVRVMTADLEHVATASDLDKAELSLDEETLAGLEVGTTLAWQVDAFLGDGSRVTSGTYHVVLGKEVAR